MFTYSRLNSVVKSSKEVDFDDSSKIVLMSDCHRGDGSWKDNLAPNRNIYYSALQYYYKNDFTYIELGDGDDLWENRKFINIWNSYEEVFKLLYEFHLKKRLYLLFGNHDIAKKNKKYIGRNNSYLRKHSFYRNTLHANLLFSIIDIHEGIILKYVPTDNKILLIHGHQGDLMNDTLWRFSRFAVRYFWGLLEGLFGFNDPTSPAKNYSRKSIVEKEITKWILDNKYMVIAGHTHRPHFPAAKEAPYFNDGSCVHPYSVTAIEITSGKIHLVKWFINSRSDGTLFVDRKMIKGPRNLVDCFDFDK